MPPKETAKKAAAQAIRPPISDASLFFTPDDVIEDLDEGLMEFQKLVTLNLCGNFIENIDATFVPASVRAIELQANRIRSVEAFVENLSPDVLYFGLARNLLNDDGVEGLARLPHYISVLDLSDNDIYNLDPLLEALVRLPNLTSLQLAGNPCSVCAGYARITLMRLTRLKWLDSREILSTDRSVEPFVPHPDDLRSAYFNFTIFRVMSAVQPPKLEKGSVMTFHIELQIPLLDSTRRRFLMFRRYESLTEMVPPPEDEEWPVDKNPSHEASSHESDVYKYLEAVNSREIRNFTTYESNRVQWNKIMNFQEPTIRIFCPDLVALRDTFRTPPPSEQRVVLATMKCALRQPDWSQTSQCFHWDDSLGTDDAIHWGDGDLSVLQYIQGPIKSVKGKTDTDLGSTKQPPPENLTCHFGFSIDTLRA
ncbi:Uncharacterized protein OBRU01_23103 [Operophtera brumata]|uniref:Leucine-rich repeat-containing protein n=1 Tax=Operophtera brumata TaxID=104452 RepID=A0A0L7KQ55_OPEBR|nr:Uncharacterized protein OBRU01_23103 [Operophtera brumata]